MEYLTRQITAFWLYIRQFQRRQLIKFVQQQLPELQIIDLSPVGGLSWKFRCAECRHKRGLPSVLAVVTDFALDQSQAIDAFLGIDDE